MPSPLEAEVALNELLAAVELQLAAARTANAAALRTATETRRTIQEGLDACQFANLDVERRQSIVRLARRIRGLDARIRACGENVLGAIAAMAPDRAPTTYSRRGVLRSAS